MIVLLSPAKTFETSCPPLELLGMRCFEPRLAAEAAYLAEVLREKSQDELSKLMRISDKLAELNYQRFQHWKPPSEGSLKLSGVERCAYSLSVSDVSDTQLPALYAFKGDVYRNMDVAGELSREDYEYAHHVLRILSGLYGVLRPLDMILPYRLEMGTRLQTPEGKNLYEYWGDSITDVINQDLLSSSSSAVVVNLASQEYFKVVNASKLKAQLVTPVFLDGKKSAAAPQSAAAKSAATTTIEGSEPKVVGLFAKRARGAMAGWIIKNRVETVEELSAFQELGYSYDKEYSTEDRMTFVRWT